MGIMTTIFVIIITIRPSLSSVWSSGQVGVQWNCITS